MQEMQETWVRSLGGEDPLKKGTATHSSILAWRIPWTEEPGGLQAIGSQRVGHNWATNITFTIVYQIQLFCCFGLSLTDPAPWLTLSAVSFWNCMPGLCSLSGLCQFSPCGSAFPITGSIPEPHLLAESSSRGACPAGLLSSSLPSAIIRRVPMPGRCWPLSIFSWSRLYTLCIVCFSTWMLHVICPLFVSQSFSLTFDKGSR